MYSGAGHKSTPVFILTGVESGTEQLSSGCNYLEGKQTWIGQTTSSLSTTNCLKNPFSGGSLTKAHFLATSQSSELLCPLLQHTEPKLLHSRPKGLHIRTKFSFVCRHPDILQQGSLASLELILTKRRRSKQTSSYCVAREARNYSTVLCIILYSWGKSRNQPPLTESHSLGHIRNPSTSMGFQWRKCIETSHTIKAEDL